VSRIEGAEEGVMFTVLGSIGFRFVSEESDCVCAS
jgi:hypothetical protein